MAKYETIRYDISWWDAASLTVAPVTGPSTASLHATPESSAAGQSHSEEHKGRCTSVVAVRIASTKASTAAELFEAIAVSALDNKGSGLSNVRMAAWIVAEDFCLKDTRCTAVFSRYMRSA